MLNIIQGAMMNKQELKQIIIEQLIGLKESYDKPTPNTPTIIREIQRKFQKVVDKYKKYQVQDTTIPSAPDTNKFRASVGGFIKLVVNEQNHEKYTVNF